MSVNKAVLFNDNFHNFPSIFKPINLRSGNRFRSLPKHYFTKYEKEWLCSMSNGSTEKCSNVCVQYGLSMTIIKEWIEIFESKEAFVDGFCVSMYSGCPVDAIGMSAIQMFISENYAAESGDVIINDETNQEFHELINDQIIKSWERSFI